MHPECKVRKLHPVTGTLDWKLRSSTRDPVDGEKPEGPHPETVGLGEGDYFGAGDLTRGAVDTDADRPPRAARVTLVVGVARDDTDTLRTTVVLVQVGGDRVQAETAQVIVSPETAVEKVSTEETMRGDGVPRSTGSREEVSE